MAATIWMLWLLLAAGSAAAQAPVRALPAEAAVRRSSIIASDATLIQRRDTAQAELAKLDADQRVACQGGAQSPNCLRFITSTQARRAGLAKQVDFNQRHVPSGQQNNCKGCHQGPGAAGASDPIRPGGATGTGGTGSGAGNTGSSGSGSSNTGSGGTITPPATRCFIATAAFGGAAREVSVLRRWRDEQLRRTPVGRAFIAGYERLSPPLAEAIADRPWVRAAVRGLLVPVVGVVEHPLRALALGLAMAALAACVRRLRAAR